jgi:hypothetical protein
MVMDMVMETTVTTEESAMEENSEASSTGSGASVVSVNEIVSTSYHGNQ